MSTFIVAEIGINHNGDPQLAREPIDAAVVTRWIKEKCYIFI